MDFIKLAKGLCIDFESSMVTFGVCCGKETFPNLYIEPNNTLCLSALVDNELQVLKFDTGSTVMDLSYAWYCAHKDSTSNLEESNVLLGTYGSTEKKGLLSMPEVPFEVDGKGAIVHNVLIHTTPDGNQHSERQINLSNQFIEGFMEVIKYGANGKRHTINIKN